MRVIDSHCHLNYLKCDDSYSLDQVIQQAHAEGVEKIVTIGVRWHELDEILAIADRYEQVYASVGVHPSELDSHQPSLEELIAKSRHHKCVAIGETGLDYHYNDESTYSLQKDKFVTHIHAGIATQKPIVVHTRSAKQDTLDILRAEQVEKCGGILHCFTEDWDMAKQVLDLGMYISFSGIVTFKNAQDIQAVAKQMPLDRLLIETDAPYLTPVPYRGKPNYPHHVVHVAQFIAELRGISVETVAEQSYHNTKLLLNL